MLNAFVERWHIETSSFHLPLGEMSITLGEVSCLLHLPIRGKILENERINKYETLELMVDYLRVDPTLPRGSLKPPERLMLGFDFWRMYIQMSWLEQSRLMVIRRRQGGIKHMLWEHTCYIWLTLPFLWTRVPLMWMSYTYDTLRTLNGSMSTTRRPLVWFTCTLSYPMVVGGRRRKWQSTSHFLR